MILSLTAFCIEKIIGEHQKEKKKTQENSATFSMVLFVTNFFDGSCYDILPCLAVLNLKLFEDSSHNIYEFDFSELNIKINLQEKDMKTN